jgi:hypothetical protein
MIIWRRRLSAVVAIGALGLALSACSSSNSPSASQTTTTNSKTSGTVPVSVPNQDNVRKDVDMVNCGPAQGGWSAGGTVKNSLGHAATYDITVYFTSSQATDLSYASTSVPVNTGQSKLWSVKATFTAPSTVLCVLRGVAAS